MSDELKKDGDQKNSYSETLNLPQTDFPIRAQFSIFDQAMIQRWADEKLSEKTYQHNAGKTKFILHDGPPYSNGHIHLGHAYNKISKDIVTKSERMTGKHVPVIPGWDCHGLPIELKVTQEQKFSSKQELKKACRTYAQHWIEVQREEFKKLGVMMHWDKPYTTMSFSYEAAIVRAFGEFFKQGYIAKKLKTVPWCASCQTVLANAEIEYNERKDPSLYVEFPLTSDMARLASDLGPRVKPEDEEGGRDGKKGDAAEQLVSLLVWTTTPWTLPLNRAVVVHPQAQYALVKINEKLVIMGKDLVEKVAATMGNAAFEVLKVFPSTDLIGQKVNHPFIANLQVPIIGDDMVSLSDGTACVHSAPGCGPEDYEVALKHNLEIYSPLTADGKYTSDIIPVELAGMSVADGQIWVIKKLAELDRILLKQSIRHSYPHCWRCRNGLIFRATSQWFCDLSQHNLKNKALEAIESLRMIPATGKNRFSATLEGRLEWCLSRQRTWGVPIPALNCLDCGHVFTSPELIETAARGIEKSGIEFWDEVSLSDLGAFACGQCSGKNLAKEFDILDVWFESGVSHYAVLYHNPEQAYPADMYLEGKDQHRAWFQSSLLASLVLEKSACMKEILTHGFTVDAQGKKMSKSLGNVVTPQEIITQVGTDGLRLWVASSDYDSDPIVSELLLKNISEVYRKVRNTCRFLLSNLYDFDITKDGVAVENMLAVDQQAIMRLHAFNESIQLAYRERKTTAVFHELADYCAKDLSALYLDIIKDRLYVEKPDSVLRRSAQTACYHILHTMNTLMAPILSLTAEQVFDHYKNKSDGSIHLQDFAHTKSFADQILSHAHMAHDEFHAAWTHLAVIRDAVLKKLEVLREQGEVKHSLDGAVSLQLDADKTKLFSQIIKNSNQALADFFKEYFIVSQVQLVENQGALDEIMPGAYLAVSKATGLKCNRCWQWFTDLNSGDLCGRCAALLHPTT